MILIYQIDSKIDGQGVLMMKSYIKILLEIFSEISGPGHSGLYLENTGWETGKYFRNQYSRIEKY